MIIKTRGSIRKMKENKIKLILHIGAGKTGTTSIQQTLKKNQNELKKQGVYYLGLMLENAYLQKYKWQNITFYKMMDKKAEDQLLEILLDTIQIAKEEGIHTLIWSNESFFTRNKKLLNIMHKLKKYNIEIQIVSYVRRHDAWARSAYQQWGISHKIYKGRIKTFKEWANEKKFKFYDKISFYYKDFPAETVIKNMDAIGDVVPDFLELCGINADNIRIVRSNESVSNEELVLRAIYNDSFKDSVMPMQFLNRVIKKQSINLTPTEYLATLMPSEEDLNSIQKDLSEDREQLNLLLTSQNQKTIDVSKLIYKNIAVDTDKLVMLLCEIVIGQSLKINNLEDALESINMRKCIVHIGMHKTGSSSIQDTLYKTLSDENFIYAKLGVANHGGKIFTLFTEKPENYAPNRKKGLSKEQIEENNIATKKMLIESFVQNRFSDVIISGEGILFLSEEALNRFKSFLKLYFDQILIVAYVRPPMALIESGYQQRIKENANINLDEMRPNYQKKLEKFEKVFGPENVKYWKFEPSRFEKNNVVLDFCSRLGIQIDQTKIIRSNDSITQEALMLLLCYRKFGPGFGVGPTAGQENNLLIKELNKIGEKKFRLSKDFLEPVLRDIELDMAWMEKRLGKESLREERDFDDNAIVSEDELLHPSKETIGELIQLIGKDHLPDTVGQEEIPIYVAKLVQALRIKIKKRKH